MLIAKSISLKDANAFVGENHRHHPPVHRDKFRVSAYDTEQKKIVGVVQIGRPVSRALDDGDTVEVVRLCSDGTRNTCSFLYSRAARISKEMGFKRIITYILESEDGASLKASGWAFQYKTKGHNWSCPSRPRDTKAPTCDKLMWMKILAEEAKDES